MAKYYVKTGNLRVVISRPDIKNHVDAACEACLTFYSESTVPDRDIIVSEEGFKGHKNDKTFDTFLVLRKAGFEFE